MPPALKVLSLVTTILCVVLFFGIFAIDGKLRRGYTTLKKDFYAGRESAFSKKAKTSPITKGGTQGNTEASSTKNYILRFDFSSDGTYFDMNSTSTGTVEVDTLTRLGGNYYQDKENVYYLILPKESCDSSFESKAIRLPIDDARKISSALRGNIINDMKSVFVYYLKITDADPATFVYVGSIINEAWKTTQQSKYWYKDKNKIFVITRTVNDCNGEDFSVSEDTSFKDSDAMTFEYLGVDAQSRDNAYGKDKNYFYGDTGALSQSVTPQTCKGDFFKECLPSIKLGTSSVQQ